MSRGGAGAGGARGGPGATDDVAVGSLVDAWKVEAARDMGIQPKDLILLLSGDGFSFLWTGSNGSGGVRTATTGAAGSRFSTGGGAGGFALMSSATGPTTASFEHLLAGLTARWWLKARMAVNPAGAGGGPPGAGTSLGIGAAVSGQALASATHELMIGVEGAGANFVMAGAAGATIDSGVPVDALVRDHKGWRDGSSSYYQIDSRAPVAGTARPSAASRAVVLAFDSAAVVQVLDIYVAAVAFPVRALGA